MMKNAIALAKLGDECNIHVQMVANRVQQVVYGFRTDGQLAGCPDELYERYPHRIPFHVRFPLLRYGFATP